MKIFIIEKKSILCAEASFDERIFVFCISDAGVSGAAVRVGTGGRRREQRAIQARRNAPQHRAPPSQRPRQKFHAVWQRG